ncbi:hypothetical protein ACOSP7_008801 [Xanthoceras sorbifolium]
MASFFSLVSFATILLVSSSAIYPSSGIPEEILKTICSSVGHSGTTTCMSILKSDPRTASADLPQLSLISIELTKKQADSNIRGLKEIITAWNSTDPQIERRCRPCVGIYQDIKSLLQEAHQKSEVKHYADISEFDGCLHLANKCAALCSVNSISLDQLSQAMISSCQTCQAVNKYMVSQISIGF